MRTAKWCLAKGLVYTGMSNRSKDTLQSKLDELRAKGYTAYLSQWPHDPLSRSLGTGYSIYADKKWAWDRQEQEISESLKKLPGRRLYLHAQLIKELEGVQAEEDELNRRLAEIRVKQMGGPW